MELFNLQSGSTLQEKAEGKAEERKKAKNQTEIVFLFERVAHKILIVVYIQLVEKVKRLHGMKMQTK